jgi:formylglycine-generating enzyme required for sulfatase activity
MDAVASLARGEALGRYIVIERLGAGAMGVVYAAYDPELDRKVAIKILRWQEGGGEARESRRRARLEREAKAIAKLAHAHVVSIFDVGVDGGRVFLAMEYLAGGTLRAWLGEKKRPWREIVKMFVAVGRGLAAAHAEGLVHRDFKPDNVLLDRAGTPKVVDFGLARPSSASGPDGESNDGLRASSSSSENTPPSLTQTGAFAGTPAYMAPEQFMSRETDSRSDQFAFCVALYEALYGQRPFAGETVFDLAETILHERVDAPPKSANVPGWIRRSLLRGLRADRELRWKKLEDLLAALEADPVARARRVVAASLVTVAVVGTIGGLYRRSEHRRLEFEGRVASKLNEGRQALAEAAATEQVMNDARRRAFSAFDGARREEGEVIWADARTSASKLDTSLKRAQMALEAAISLDPANGSAREALGEALFQRALLAELESRPSDLGHILEQIERVDASGRLMARWTSPGSIRIEISPRDARLVLERYETAADDGNHLRPVLVRESARDATGSLALAPGSYRVTATKEGFAETRLPFVVKRGESARYDLRLPPASDVPPDFVYVPAGRFLSGDPDEDLRLGFLNAAPIHERSAPAFLIKAHETTFGDWLEFLRDLPPAERRLRTPSTSVQLHGSVVVRQSRNDAWSIEFDISGPKMSARAGSPIVYPTRKMRASQDWLRMPVLGVSQKDMQAYLDWLSRTGRVPGARFCNEIEWERAARGADGRSYPASRVRLASDDANIDLTYGRVAGSYGPDEVGSHPCSVSPFGIQDMAGNAWELVEAHDEPSGYGVRGGSYYHALPSARSANREGYDRSTRSYIVGLRVCVAQR